MGHRELFFHFEFFPIQPLLSFFVDNYNQNQIFSSVVDYIQNEIWKYKFQKIFFFQENIYICPLGEENRPISYLDAP